MSVTKTKATRYHETEQPVRFGIKWLKITGLDDLKTLCINGLLSGKVGSAPGEVDFKEQMIWLKEIKENCTATEKGILKKAIAIFERELARADKDLSEEQHDNTDVFVDNSKA